MLSSPIIITLTFTLLWFVLYWLVAGVLFAIIGLVRFMRINTARFSCLFTLLSLVTAYAAAWTSYVAAARTAPRCVGQINAAYEAIPGLLRCAATITMSNAILWFIVLLAVGIALLFVTRLPDHPRQTSKT